MTQKEMQEAAIRALNATRLLRCTHLSLQAKGMLAILVTFPGEHLDVTAVAGCIADEPEVAEAALRELADAGVIEVEHVGGAAVKA